MSNTLSQIQFENAQAEVFCFDNGTEVRECHVMIHISRQGMTFSEQLEAVQNAYTQLIETHLPGTQAVFKRYFLSDAANQQDEVIVSDVTDCAKSIIQQALSRWNEDCIMVLSYDRYPDRLH